MLSEQLGVYVNVIKTAIWNRLHFFLIKRRLFKNIDILKIIRGIIFNNFIKPRSLSFTQRDGKNPSGVSFLI